MIRPRVLIADDHALVAQAFRSALEPAYDVVGVVCDGRALVSAALALKPSLVVCDISMPLMNGMEAARIIQAQLPAVMVVFLTMDQNPAWRRPRSGWGAADTFSRLQTSMNCRVVWRWSGLAAAI